MSSQLPPPRPEDWKSGPETSSTGGAPSSRWLTPAKLVAVVVGALLLIGALVAGAALLNDDEERPTSAAASTTGAATSQASAPASTGGQATTAPGSTGQPAATTGVATSSAAGTQAPSATSAPAPVSPPGGTGAPPGTTPATVPPGTVPVTVPPGITVAPTDGSTAQALVLAQQLGDALAAGRWDEARRLNPGRNESDAFLDQEYGPLEATTIVLASSQPAGDHVDLRIGLVAHEARSTGPQTSLFCSRWRVDLTDGTVQRLAYRPLRVEAGYVAPSARADELRQTCRTASLD